MNNLKFTSYNYRMMHSKTFLVICLSLFGCGNGKNVATVTSENEIFYAAPEQKVEAMLLPEETDEILLNHHATQKAGTALKA